MSWLYGQTWLWYLLAFLVGVLLAWIVLVLPARRKLRALRGAGPDGRDDRDPVTAGPAVDDPDRADRTAVDDAATEQFPAVNPALSTLDTFGTGTGTRGAATAGLGAAGLEIPTTPAGDTSGKKQDPDTRA